MLFLFRLRPKTHQAAGEAEFEQKGELVGKTMKRVTDIWALNLAWAIPEIVDEVELDDDEDSLYWPKATPTWSHQ